MPAAGPSSCSFTIGMQGVPLGRRDPHPENVLSGRSQSRSSSPFRKAQNGSTDEIFSRSLGLCTSTIYSPNKIICMPGTFRQSRRTPARRAWRPAPGSCPALPDAPPAPRARCRWSARASNLGSPRVRSTSKPASRNMVDTMRPAASVLLSIALRWLVSISTSSSLVDTVARFVDGRILGRRTASPTLPVVGSMGTPYSLR